MRFLHLSDYGRCAFGGDPTLNRITLSRVALSAKAQRYPQAAGAKVRDQMPNPLAK